jgi:hypothetical protein
MEPGLVAASPVNFRTRIDKYIGDFLGEVLEKSRFGLKEDMMNRL